MKSLPVPNSIGARSNTLGPSRPRTAAHHLFFEYGDAERYRDDLKPLRDALRPAPSRRTRSHAAPAVAAWIAAHVDRPVVVGPDAESAQWVTDVARRVGAPSVVMRKERRSDRVVEVFAPDMEPYRRHTPVVVDDLASSAQTMVETVERLVGGGLRAPVCVAVHALFTDTAEQALRDAGAARIVTTTTVPHSTNAIDVVPMMIEPVRELC